MIEVNSTLFWGLIEVSVILLLVLVALLVIGFLRKQKDKQAAQELVVAIRKDADARAKEMKRRLGSDYGYEGEALKKAVVEIKRKELFFYQFLINTYLNRSTSQLSQINIAFEDAVAPYRSFEVPTGGGADESELEELRKQNHDLSEELRVTMDTMSRMLEEYSGMFATDTAEQASASSEEAQQQAVGNESGEEDAARQDDLADIGEAVSGTEFDIELDQGGGDEEVSIDFDDDELADTIDPTLL